MHDVLLFSIKRLFYEYRRMLVELFCGLLEKDNTVIRAATGKGIPKERHATDQFSWQGKINMSRSTLSVIYEDSRGWIWYGTAYQELLQSGRGSSGF